jgi:tRNA threonylcarbamoyladenosine biosynthesis protein TsaE
MRQNPAVPPPFGLALPDEAATEALGRALAAIAEPGVALLLQGPLGAGKTCLARALIRAVGEACGETVAEVPSPTFTLVQIYAFGTRRLWHFDLYRLRAAEEIDELGWEDALTDIAIVEWPERLGETLPRDRVEIALSFADGARRAEVRGRGKGEALVQRLALQVADGHR